MSDDIRKTTKRKAVEAEPPRRKTGLLIAVAAAGIVLVGGGVALVVTLGSGGEPIAQLQPEDGGKPSAGPRVPGATPAVAARDDEAEAKALFEAAHAAEATQPDRPDLAIAKYRDVRVKFPQSTWASKAEGRTRELEEKLKKLFEGEFESVRAAARERSSRGDWRGALEGLAAYLKSDAKEILKKRADVEAGAIANESRDRFNQAVIDAQALAKKGAFDEAAATFTVLLPGLPDDLRLSAQAETEAIAIAKKEFAEVRTQLERDALEEKVYAAGPAVLEACRHRRYDEALKTIDALPACDWTKDEREAVAAAAVFWDAFLKSLRARVGQEVSLLLADGKRASGRLAKVADDRATVGAAEVPFEKLHDDQVTILAVGRGALPEGAAETYVRASMFFFIDGKRELSRIYLATARELGAKAEAVERAWRGGLVQAAMVPKK